MKKKVIFIIFIFFMLQYTFSGILVAQEDPYSEEDDYLSTLFGENQQDETINYEELTLLEQIQLGYYTDLIDKYIKQLMDSSSTGAYKSDATYALSKILQIEADNRPVDALLKAIDSRPHLANNYIRRYAALALGFTNDSRAIPALIAAMKRKTQGINPITEEQIPEDIYVRLYACYSLGRLKAKEASRDIVNILREKKESRILRRQAALSLGMILDESVYSKVADVLKDLKQDKLIIRNTIWTLGEYGRFGYKDEFVLQTLLKLTYQNKPDVVIRVYNALENLLGTQYNEETSKIIDETVSILEETISTEQYRNYLNILYEADNITIDDKAVKAVNNFIEAIKRVKGAVSSQTTLRYITQFLSLIKNPETFVFPKGIVFLKEVDKIVIKLEDKKIVLDSIDISASKRDALKQLFENASSALSLLSDDEEALKQAEIYLKAKNILEIYDVVVAETISYIEPLKYIDDLKKKYVEAIEAMDDFFYIYTRRQAALAIGKIYIKTYKKYLELYERLKKTLQIVSMAYNNIVNDRNNILKVSESLIGKDYANYFTKQTNFDEISKNLEAYIESTDISLKYLKNIIRDYYLTETRNPRSVMEEKVSDKTIYNKEPNYNIEDIGKLYRTNQIEIIKTNVVIEFSDEDSFKKFIEDKEIVFITKTDSEQIVGVVVEEDHEERDYIRIKKANDEIIEIFLDDIQSITYYNLPEEIENNEIALYGEFTSTVVRGVFSNTSFDEGGRKINVKTFLGEDIEIYLKNIEKLIIYLIPEGLIGEELIVLVGSDGDIDDRDYNEVIGEFVSIDEDENGKIIILKTPRGNRGILLRNIKGIVLYSTISGLIGERVIIQLVPEYFGSDDEDIDYYVLGTIVEENLDKITISTVELDGSNIYEKETYYRDIYITDIKQIISDYSIPDILSLGVKSIEFEELSNKLKYDAKNSIMVKFDEASRKLSKVSSAQSKFSTLSVILNNASTTLGYYENSEIAKAYKKSIDDAIEAFENIEKNIDKSAQTLSKMKNYIDDNVFKANFLSKAIKENIDDIDPKEEISALNNILEEVFINDSDIFVRLNCSKALINIDYPSYTSTFLNILQDENDVIEMRIYAFETLSSKGFPSYSAYTKEDLKSTKYDYINKKIEEMEKAKKSFESFIYQYATVMPGIYDDINFDEHHVLRVASVIALSKINTAEAKEILSQLIGFAYPYKITDEKYNSKHKSLTDELRRYAIRTFVNKKDLTIEDINKVAILLINIVDNLDEYIKVRIDATRGIGKLARKIEKLVTNDVELEKFRLEALSVLPQALIFPINEFKSAIIWTVGELKHPQGVEIIKSVLFKKISSTELKKTCLYALAKIASEEAIYLLKEFAMVKEEELKLLAKDLLKRLGVK